MNRHLKNHDPDIKKKIRVICNLCESGKDHGNWKCPQMAAKKIKFESFNLSTEMKEEKIREIIPEEAKLYQCRMCDYNSPLKKEALEHFNDLHPGLSIKISIHFSHRQCHVIHSWSSSTVWIGVKLSWLNATVLLCMWFFD